MIIYIKLSYDEIRIIINFGNTLYYQPRKFYNVIYFKQLISEAVKNSDFSNRFVWGSNVTS